MKFCMFYHSIVSDWNHGNAHFLRGVVRELKRRGHEVTVFEPADGWSRSQLLAREGAEALEELKRAHADLESIEYGPELDLDDAVSDADVVIVHEWNEPALVARIGAHRRSAGGYRLLFHDTHHRSVSAPEEMERYELDDYDGVLAFGAVIREIYVDRSWAQNVWVWHEAADTSVFRPQTDPDASEAGDVVWVGNWGDGERTSQIEEFLLGPIEALQARGSVYGVRYPRQALERLTAVGARYQGWLPNHRVPQVFGRHLATVHIPREFYVTHLPGIPTIRPFEALACGIPLVCSPWDDAESLFRPGVDYLVARDGEQMVELLDALTSDAYFAQQLASNGRETIEARHTCAHRVDELLEICRELGVGRPDPAPTARANSQKPTV